MNEALSQLTITEIKADFMVARNEIPLRGLVSPFADAAIAIVMQSGAQIVPQTLIAIRRITARANPARFLDLKNQDHVEKYKCLFQEIPL